jgi:hypothetical protein
MRLRTLALSMAVVPTVLAGTVPAVVADPADSAEASPERPSVKAGVKPWVKLSGPVDINRKPGVLRFGQRLEVIWSQDDPGSVRSARARVLDAAGRPASTVRRVVTGWLSVIADPELLMRGNDLMAVFAGLRGSGPGDPYDGPAVFATSHNGLGWQLQPGSLSQTTAAGNAESIDAIDGAGKPMFAMGGFSHVVLHRGTSGSSPAGTADFNSADFACCPLTFVTLANDRGSKRVYLAFHPLGATTRADAGVFVQRVWPRPNGPLLHAPGSASASGPALNPGQPVAMAERVGGGVWVAYRLGYPTSTRIRLWKVGTKTHWDVKSPGHTLDDVALAPGPGGRLWLSWRTVGDGKLHAARTNPSVTRLGAIGVIRPPGGDGFITNTTLEGSRGPLDVVANASTKTGSSAIYAVHVLPGLSVTAKPGKLGRGKVTVRVTDAGTAVRNAKVTFRGKTVRTDKAGHAVFRVGARVPSGRYAVAASRAGYAKATVGVRVT